VVFLDPVSHNLYTIYPVQHKRLEVGSCLALASLLIVGLDRVPSFWQVEYESIEGHKCIPS
jgi:hypothetical protein